MARARASGVGRPGRRQSPWRTGALASALAAALAACASRPATPTLAPGHEGAPGVERFLLGPANLIVALRSELEPGVEPIQQEIVAHLRAHGREVERLGLPEARAAWEGAIEEVRAKGSGLRFEAAATPFARRLAQTHRFEAIVLPALIVQETTVRHRGAQWDGVQRRIPVVNAPRRRAGRNRDLLVDGLSGGSLNATVHVASLLLIVLAPDGSRVFEGRGGLDFLEEVDLAQAVETFRFQINLRGDLLQDREILREGVGVAFTPYLPPLRPR